MTPKPAIYGLIDPRDGALRYIGKANNPSRRLTRHHRDSRRRSTPVYAWMRKLAGMGLAPDMLVLEDACDDWRASERSWIERGRRAGLRLLNVADGGDEPACPKSVQRANAKFANDPAILGYRAALRQLGAASRAAKLRGDTARQSRMDSVIARLRDMTKAERLAFSGRYYALHPHG